MRWDRWRRAGPGIALLVLLGPLTAALAGGSAASPPPPPPPPPTLPTPTTPRPPPSAAPGGAAAIRLDPRYASTVDCSPVRTQHTLVVTVYDRGGNPVPGQRVEWILARYPEAVGDIVAVDDAGVGAAGGKRDNHHAVSVTNSRVELVDRGNDYPVVDRSGHRLPDLAVGRGQTWLTVTATREGVTDLVIIVPGIRDGQRHKIFAKVIWADYHVVFPEDSVNLLPETEHRMPVRVTRTDGTGIPGVAIEAEVLDGPDAVFAESGERTTHLLTDANGDAATTLRNVAGAPGVNRVRFTALGSFYGDTCPRSAIVAKTWQQVVLEVTCRYPDRPEAFAGKPFRTLVTVRNVGQAPAENVVLDDRPQGGLAIDGANPFPVRVGTLAPGQSHTQPVRMVAGAPGTYANRVIATSTSGEARSENVCRIQVVQGILDVTKTCRPEVANTGDKVTFSVVVSNRGGAPLEHVRVRDLYPHAIEPASQGEVDLGTMLPGESQEIVFTGIAREPGRHVNRARATADGVPAEEASCEFRVVACDLEMTLEGPAQVYFNEPTTFKLTVRNAGDGPGEGCTVRVTAGACLGSAVRDFVLGTLPPGEGWSQEFTLVGTQVGSCRIQADASCGERCQTREERAVQVTGLPALQVEMVDKSVDGSEAGIFRVGETFLYRLTVLNDIGTEPTPELVASWRLPPELEFVSARSDRDASVEGNGTFAQSDKFTLGIREQITFEVVVRVLSVPRSGFVVTTAIVSRASDGMELSSETENTSIRP